MESPINLLKLAVCENNSETRLAQVVKACKIITTLLPFDRKNHALVEEPELMKYLLIALPINPRTIDMIIVSMVKKFKKLHYFLKELWYSFTMVAQLEEARQANLQKSESAMRLYQNDVKKLLKLATLKDLDEVTYSPTSRVSEYCDLIDENKEWIKLATLEYVDHIIELYNKELKYSVAFKPDIAELLKKFIIFSPSDKVIIRVCAIIEKVSFIEKNSMLNHEIEQLVLNKQSMVIDSTSRAALENTPRVQGKIKLKRALSKIKEENPSISEIRKSGQRSGMTTPRSERSPPVSPLKRNASKDLRKNPSTTSLEGVEEVSTAAVDSVETGLEKWLSEGEMDEVPLISKSQYIYNILKNPGNLEIILSFMFDPQAYPIGDCWREKYPSITKNLDIDESLVQSEGSTQQTKLQKLRDDKFLHSYVLRSYKTMQVFCDPANVKYFLQMDSSAVENYFSFLYACLNTRDDSACNFNHIGKVTSFLVRKEADICVNYLIYYNLLYRLIQNLEFPGIEEFFLVLFNCSYSTAKIGADAYKKIMKYCEIVSFFSDLAQSMLLGQKNFDLKKGEVYYKPLGIEVLVNGAMKKSDLVGMFDDNPLTERKDSHDPFLEDELDGTNLDIDAVYIALQAAKKFDRKKVVVSKKGTQRALSQSTIERYASLREKHRRRLQTEGGDDLDLESKNTLGLETPRKGPKGGVTFQRQKTGTGFMLDEKKTSTSSGVIIKTRINSEQAISAVAGHISPKNTNFHSPASSVQSPSHNILRSRPSLTHNNTVDNSPATKKDGNLGMQTMTSMNGVDGFKSVRSFRAVTEQGDDYESLPMVTSKSNLRSGQIPGSRLNLEKKPTLTYYGNAYVAPERITLAQEMINDVMTPEEALQLNVLYPISSANRVEMEIDKEAKKQEFSVGNIRQNEQFAVMVCNLFESLFRKALFTPMEETEQEILEKLKNEDKGKKRRIAMKRKLGFLDVDYTPFWNAIFFNNGNNVFETLLRNYLLKIKIHHLEEMDSGFGAGTIVNLLLSKCQTHHELSKFATQIETVCKDHLKFLCKVIIQSHAWPLRKDNKIYLQNFEVTQPLGSGRILLVETLYWIIKNDEKNNCKVMTEINDTCWHTLVIWCFSKKTNNVYHRLFFSIMELIFKHCNEKFIMNILFKLEILSSMYRVYGEVYLNNVLLKDHPSESIICYMKKLVNLIESVSTAKERWEMLRSQLNASISWNYLKEKLLPPPPPQEKKKTTIIQGRRGSKMVTARGSVFSNNNRNTPRANSPRGESRNSARGSILQKTAMSQRDSIRVPPIMTSGFKDK